MLQNISDNLQEHHVDVYTPLPRTSVCVKSLDSISDAKCVARNGLCQNVTDSAVACTRKVSAVGAKTACAASIVGWRAQSVRSVPAGDHLNLYSDLNLWIMFSFEN